MISIDWEKELLSVGEERSFKAAQVVSKLSDFLTSDRKDKIQKILEHRSSFFVPVLENIYDRGNISAVMRSAEAFGFYKFHIINRSEKFKESARVTQGADKWLDIKTWNETGSCVQHLKKQGYKVYTTHLTEESQDLNQMSFDEPVALILGNEKEGVSKEALELSDGNVLLPMVGFTQSFNISVAGALACYTAYQKSLSAQASRSLNEKERALLEGLYFLKSAPWAEDQLIKFLSRN